MAGGNNASGVPLRRVDVYDPATNTWLVGTAIPTARANAGAAIIAGKWYVFGGKKGTAYLNTLEVYDPAVGGRNATAALGTNERFTP